MSNQPVIIIPARMAASRLPGKPLADIAGLPMIVQVWKRAMESGIGPVLVAADAAGTCMMPVIATHAIAAKTRNHYLCAMLLLVILQSPYMKDAISRRHFLAWLSVEHNIRKIFPIFYHCSRIGRKIPLTFICQGDYNKASTVNGPCQRLDFTA